MLEKVRAVSNPLTIIAIFAALAEVAGTVALATVSKDLQEVFVWFVMGFPVLLVVLFFATLNFNPKVLYAPSDFRDDETFLNALVGTRSVSVGLDEVTHQLEEAKDRILKQVVEEITQVGGAERSKLSAILDHQLEQLETRIQSVRQTAEAVASSASQARYPLSNLQVRILRFLKKESEPKSLGELASAVGFNVFATMTALHDLVENGLVVQHKGLRDGSYSLAVARPTSDSTDSP